MHEARTETRGRGPRNWRRSDDRIAQEVCEALTRDPWIDASEISVRVEDRIVTLEGEVDAREQRYHAEDLAAAVLGVEDVMAHIRVRDFVPAQRWREPPPTRTMTASRPFHPTVNWSRTGLERYGVGRRPADW
ncbi:MAG: BON domain-containing protein [Myxococcota bacterium]|nr:BON domain-containing protein [Myxococcota bacterium]